MLLGGEVGHGVEDAAVAAGALRLGEGRGRPVPHRVVVGVGPLLDDRTADADADGDGLFLVDELRPLDGSIENLQTHRGLSALAASEQRG